ncbi:hypothetical protein V6N11_016747 [Hibiscus sabdariffa]|uniref:Uncharacterized protein n=1 Tax=Hibiscus sabdariffa TaxID=183260 RepID=A0ABR2TWB5_9ROSI
MNTAATDNHSGSRDVLQDHTGQDIHDSFTTASPSVGVPNVEESGDTPRVDDTDTVEHTPRVDGADPIDYENSNQSNDTEDINPGMLNDLSQQVQADDLFNQDDDQREVLESSNAQGSALQGAQGVSLDPNTAENADMIPTHVVTNQRVTTVERSKARLVAKGY